jgi:hypothetical protein
MPAALSTAILTFPRLHRLLLPLQPLLLLLLLAQCHTHP